MTKLRILQRYIVRDGLAWSADELKLIDVQYHDVRHDRGLYNRLAASGKIQRLVDEADVQRAITPPTPS